MVELGENFEIILHKKLKWHFMFQFQRNLKINSILDMKYNCAHFGDEKA